MPMHATMVAAAAGSLKQHSPSPSPISRGKKSPPKSESSVDSAEFMPRVLKSQQMDKTISDSILEDRVDDLHESGGMMHERRVRTAAREWGNSKNDLTQMSPSTSMRAEARLQSCALSIVDNTLFKTLICGTIMVNAIQLGLSVQLASGAWKMVWLVCDNAFALIFTFEMIVKLLAFRLAYFYSIWNCMDFALAWLGIVDAWVLTIFAWSGESFSNFSVFRVFRLLRLVRLLKVLRVQRDLEILVEGIFASLKSMFWISLLLVLILYVSGIFFTVIIGEAHYPSEANFDCQVYFGTIMRSMLSIFNMVLLAEWSQIIRPVYENQSFVVPFFVVICLFLTFGLFNVIVGVIVESTNQASQRADEVEMERRRNEQMLAVGKLVELLEELDTDGDHQLSKGELCEAADNDTFMDILSQIGLPKGFALSDLYLTLDQNMDRRLSGKEFVNGMFQLTYSTDFQRLCLMQLSLAQVKRLVKNEQAAMRDELHHSLGGIAREIAGLRLQVAGVQTSRPLASDAGATQYTNCPLDEFGNIARVGQWVPVVESEPVVIVPANRQNCVSRSTEPLSPEKTDDDIVAELTSTSASWLPLSLEKNLPSNLGQARGQCRAPEGEASVPMKERLGQEIDVELIDPPRMAAAVTSCAKGSHGSRRQSRPSNSTEATHVWV